MPNITDIEWNSYGNNGKNISFLTDNHDDIDTIIRDLNSGDGIGKIYNFSEEFNEIKKLLDESFLVDGNPILTSGITEIENEINTKHNEDIKKIVDNINNNLETHQSEEAETLYKKVVDKYQEVLNVLAENIHEYNNLILSGGGEEASQIEISEFPCEMIGEIPYVLSAQLSPYKEAIEGGFEELKDIYSYYQKAEKLYSEFGGYEGKNQNNSIETTEFNDSVKEIIEKAFGDQFGVKKETPPLPEFKYAKELAEDAGIENS